MAPDAPDHALIRIRDLRFRYSGSEHDVLRIPALDVAGAGLTALTGPSGVGKSTLVELLAGTLREPYDGVVEVLGTDWQSLRRDTERQRHLRRIGLIPQDYGLLPGKTVRETLRQDLTDAGVPRGEQDGRIDRALAQVNLSDFSSRETNYLSGGQRQRVAIARMLARQVDLVIADEPTANLDPQLADEMLGLLRGLGQRVPVIVVTHDAHVAARCDRTVLLQSAVTRFDTTGVQAQRARQGNWLRRLSVGALLAAIVMAATAGGLLAFRAFGAGSHAARTYQAKQVPPPSSRGRPAPTTPSIISNVPTADPTLAAGIGAAVRASNDRWAASMECACDSQLESVKTGDDLNSVLQTVGALQSQGQHWAISLNSWTLEWVRPSSPGSASALVSKSETRQLYQGSQLMQTCDGAYEVQYHLINVAGAWKVDKTAVPGSGQSCQDAAPPTSPPDPLAVDPEVITQKGYTPVDSTPAETPDGAGDTLYAWRAYCSGSATGRCQKIFFFDGTQFLGTDFIKDSQGIDSLSASGPQTFTAEYAVYQPSDPGCCPTGNPVTITFHYNGKSMDASGIPPGH